MILPTHSAEASLFYLIYAVFLEHFSQSSEKKALLKGEQEAYLKGKR